jgi:hypothetical protein
LRGKTATTQSEQKRKLFIVILFIKVLHRQQQQLQGMRERKKVEFSSCIRMSCAVGGGGGKFHIPCVFIMQSVSNNCFEKF